MRGPGPCRSAGARRWRFPRTVLLASLCGGARRHSLGRVTWFRGEHTEDFLADQDKYDKYGFSKRDKGAKRFVPTARQRADPYRGSS